MTDLDIIFSCKYLRICGPSIPNIKVSRVSWIMRTWKL